MTQSKSLADAFIAKYGSAYKAALAVCMELHAKTDDTLDQIVAAATDIFELNSTEWTKLRICLNSLEANGEL